MERKSVDQKEYREKQIKREQTVAEKFVFLPYEKDICKCYLELE